MTRAQSDLAIDWHELLQQIMSTGLSLSDIGRRLGGYMISQHMLRYYKLGAQPLHWRGEAMIDLWCSTTKQTRNVLPTTTLVRGHRVQHARANRIIVNLPQWPPSPQADKPAKRRKNKEAAAV